MIRIAAGERLPFSQEEMKQTGWAVEARVYAEDPTRNFLPSIGRLRRYCPPEGDGIRVDAGVFEGAEISLYYDPMIAKLIAHGADRDAATERLSNALDSFYIAGVRHNAAFLAAIAASERFHAGALSTDFIAEMFPHGFAPPAEPVAADRTILAAAVLAELKLRDSETAVDGADRAPEVPSELIVMLDGRAYPVAVRAEGAAYRISGEGVACLTATDWRPGLPLLRLRIDDRLATVQIERLPGRAFRLVHRGTIRRAQVLPPRAAALATLMPEKTAGDTSRLVQSPMPGLLTSVIVAEGQEVKAGEPLVVVEAMKMENVLRAERDGKIAKLRAKAGDSLAVDQVILEFE
jgi:propionyl-CoA carboxylase alpha chain